MKRPRFAFVLLLSALGLVAASAGDSPATGHRRDLVVWGLSVGPDTKGQDAVIREFERRNPDVNIRLLSMGAGKMDPQKLMTSIVGNVAPDCINQDRFTIADWASRGAFRSLDDLIARDKNDPMCPRKEDYYPAPWAEAMFGGKVFGIPNDADNRILYWNKTRFHEKADELRAAGLDPERAPRTWSELLRYSKVLTEFKKDGTLSRAGYLPNFGNTWLYLYAFQNNGNMMSPDLKRCTMAEKPIVEALQFIVKGYDLVGGYEKAKSFESGFLGKENDAFAIGKVAMKTDGDWILAGLARYSPDLDFGVAPAPVPDDRYNRTGRFEHEKDQFITWVGGFCYAIPKGARNVQDAWNYIKFAGSPEAQLINAKAQLGWEQKRGRTFIPRQVGNKEANESLFREFKPGDPKFAAAVKQHLEMAPFGRVRPPTFVGQKLWNEQVRALEQACYHKMSPEQALLTSQAVVQRDLDAYFGQDKYPVIDLGIPVKIGIGILAIVLVVLAILFSRLRMGRVARSEAIWAYLFISPWVIGFLLLTVGPMVASLFLSFTQYDVLNPARWVGLKNYTDLGTAESVNVFKAFGNVIYLAGVGVPLGLFTGLCIALLLNAAVKGMRFYRTCFYMPAIVPGVASAVLWTWVLTPDANKGLINAFWAKTITVWLGVAPPAWMQSAEWAKPALIAMGMWGAGSGMILWLAGLKGVPSTLYEAASLDGASPRQQFWSVTFPQLSPIIFFNTVMGFIGAMQEFDRIYIMKPPSDGSVGPDDSMLSPVFHLFQNGFTFFKMGYASSVAWVIFGIILLLTFGQFKLAPRWVHYEAEK